MHLAGSLPLQSFLCARHGLPGRMLTPCVFLPDTEVNLMKFKFAKTIMGIDTTDFNPKN